MQPHRSTSNSSSAAHIASPSSRPASGMASPSSTTSPSQHASPGSSNSNRGQSSRDANSSRLPYEQSAAAVARQNMRKPFDFQYLVIVDFEATCDEGALEERKVSRHNQEIIEFPWVVLDMTNRDKPEVVHQQQLYVRPVDVPQLTEFCTKLTGITQEKVDNAVLLIEALALFDQFIKEYFVARKLSFCIATDGNWDIQVALIGECIRKNIELQDYFFRYFDIRMEYKLAYPDAPPVDRLHLRRMRELLNIDHIGHHHSGLDDCLTIAAIVVRMLKQGQDCLRAPLHLPRDYDPAKDPGAAREFNKFKKPENPDYTVNVAGFDRALTAPALESFFAGLKVVKIQMDAVDPTQTTRALVEFAAKEDQEKALLQDKQYIGKRYVHIRPYLRPPPVDAAGSARTDEATQEVNNVKQ